MKRIGRELALDDICMLSLLDGSSNPTVLVGSVCDIRLVGLRNLSVKKKSGKRKDG